MSRTQLSGNQIIDGSIRKSDLDTTTTGSAVVTRLIAGSGITFNSTGIDAGTGDVTINSSGGGSLALNPVTLDFGSTPVFNKAFTFSAAVTQGVSKIVLVPNPDSDEYEMDGLTCSAYCSSNGTVTAFITTVPGPITGTRNFNYIIG